jgi:hypothetical protein
MGKYFGQQCQDDTLNQKFRELHYKLVDEIISFCKENNIVIDEFHLNADGVEGSIPFGKWQSCTDSYLSLEKFTEDFKDVVNFRKKVSNDEWEQIKLKQKPFLVSM